MRPAPHTCPAPHEPPSEPRDWASLAGHFQSLKRSAARTEIDHLVTKSKPVRGEGGGRVSVDRAPVAGCPLGGPPWPHVLQLRFQMLLLPGGGVVTPGARARVSGSSWVRVLSLPVSVSLCLCLSLTPRSSLTIQKLDVCCPQVPSGPQFRIKAPCPGYWLSPQTEQPGFRTPSLSLDTPSTHNFHGWALALEPALLPRGGLCAQGVADISQLLLRSPSGPPGPPGQARSLGISPSSISVWNH